MRASAIDLRTEGGEEIVRACERLSGPKMDALLRNAMAKAGTRPLSGVLGYGESPKGKGLHFLDAPAPAVENLTGSAVQDLFRFESAGRPGHIRPMKSASI